MIAPKTRLALAGLLLGAVVGCDPNPNGPTAPSNPNPGAATPTSTPTPGVVPGRASEKARNAAPSPP